MPQLYKRGEFASAAGVNLDVTHDCETGGEKKENER